VRGDKQKALGKKEKEREERRMSEEGLNPFRKSSRTERPPSRSEEANCYDAFGDLGGFNYFSKDQFPQLGTIKLHL
jgi:hypothetical protein